MRNTTSFRIGCSFILLLLLTFSTSAQIVTDSLLLKKSATIYFPFGKATLPAQVDSLLASVLQIAQVGGDLLIDISAHTDAVGSETANQQLSQRRADSVRFYFITQGIPDSLLAINTFGEDQPVADNTSEEGRQQNRRAKVQVFQKLKTTWLEGVVKDQETQKGIQAEVILHGKIFRDSFRTDSTGNWKRRVPANEVLGIDVFAPDYFYDTKMIKTTIGKNELIEMEIPMVRPGMAIPIKHLYFFGDSDRFLPRSLPELPKLLKFMLYNDSLKVEIAGHVNVPSKPPGFANQEEFNLSLRRAKAVYQYLIDNHVQPNRLRYKGYGNSEMRFPNNPTLKQQEMNRRVEVKVLDSGEVISEEEGM